jgi:hypothetical protein
MADKKTYKDDPNIKEAHEHMRAAHKSFRKSMEGWLPEGFFDNRREARKEFLLGMRSLIDYAIEKADKKTKED